MQSMDAYNDVSKSGFWGVLAQKAKEILDDNNAVPQNDTVPSKLRSHSFNTFTPAGRAQVILYICNYSYYDEM